MFYKEVDVASAGNLINLALKRNREDSNRSKWRVGLIALLFF